MSIPLRRRLAYNPGMRNSRVARRRRSSKPARTAPIFPAQRRAARQQTTALGRVTEKVTQTVSERVPGKLGSRRRPTLPRPVLWLLWLLGAATLSVAVGFVVGLTRPRTQSENQA